MVLQGEIDVECYTGELESIIGKLTDEIEILRNENVSLKSEAWIVGGP